MWASSYVTSDGSTNLLIYFSFSHCFTCSWQLVFWKFHSGEAARVLLVSRCRKDFCHSQHDEIFVRMLRIFGQRSSFFLLLIKPAFSHELLIINFVMLIWLNMCFKFFFQINNLLLVKQIFIFNKSQNFREKVSQNIKTVKGWNRIVVCTCLYIHVRNFTKKFYVCTAAIMLQLLL